MIIIANDKLPNHNNRSRASGGVGGVEVTKPPAALSPMKSPSASRGRPATSHRLPTTLPCTAVAPSAAPEKPSPHSLPHDEYCSFG